MNKTFVVLLIALFLSPLFALVTAAPVHADWLLDRSGTLVRVDGYVLGDDSSESEIETEQEKPEQTEIEKNRLEQAQEVAKNRQESARETAKKKLETQIESRKKNQERSGSKSQVEIKNDGNKLKIKQEIRDKNDHLLKKQEIEIKGDERFVVEGEDKEKVEIDTRGNHELEITKNQIKTSSDLDLKIDDKNAISVTLPNGKVREVKLPDQALNNLVTRGIIVQTEGENAYQLTTGKNGEPVYPAEAKVEKKLFGLLKIKFDQNIEVAASDSEDGTVKAGDIVSEESQETSPWRRLLERLSTN